MWKLDGGKTGWVTFDIKHGSPDSPGLDNQVCVFAPGQNAILDVNFPVNLKDQASFRALVHSLRVHLQPVLDRQEHLLSLNVRLGEDFLQLFTFLISLKSIKETVHFKEASLSKKTIQVIT